MADGSIIIDTKIDDNGMSKGFQRIKNDMGGVARQAQKMGNDINVAFSNTDFSKPVARAQAQVNSLERQLAALSSQFKIAIDNDDDISAERLDLKRMAVYERLETAREKLAIEIEAAARKQAEAEEKAAARETAAAEKKAAAQQKAARKELAATNKSGKAATSHLGNITKGFGRLSSRIGSLISGAFVFNIISQGLSQVSKYFGSALKSNDAFSKSFAKLKGALLTAFQPIYEYVVPALVTMMNVLAQAAQVVGRFFAALTGKNYGQMAENAEGLYNTASGIEAVGGAAKETKKILSGLDEINTFTADSGGGGGSVTPDVDFSELGGDVDNSTLSSLSEFVNKVTTILAPLKEINFTPLRTSFSKLGETIKDFGATVKKALGVVWEKILAPLAEWVIEDAAPATVDTLSAAFEALDSFLDPVIEGLEDFIDELEPVIDYIEDHAISVLEDFEAAFKDLSNVFSTRSSKITEIFSMLGTTVTSVFRVIEPVITLFKTNMTNAFDGISSSVGYFIDLLHATLEFISGTFTGDWELAWEGIRDIFTTIWERLLSFVTEPVNEIIDGVNYLVKKAYQAINSIITAINSIEFKLPSWLGGGSWSPSIPRKITPSPIPHLAQGAVIPPNAPFMAILGDQKHGTNIEAPVDLISSVVGSELDKRIGKSGNNVYDINVNINRRTVFEAVLEEAKLRQSTTGRNPFNLT